MCSNYRVNHRLKPITVCGRNTRKQAIKKLHRIGTLLLTLYAQAVIQAIFVIHLRTICTHSP